MTDMWQDVRSALRVHPKVRDVRLIGSRAEGRATTESDWDFRVDTNDFASVSHALPQLVRVLRPLAQQWDRLSEIHVYMLMLRGPIKVDLLFPNEHHEPLGPWSVTPEDLPALDAHFWDWTLWLASKLSHDQTTLVSDELQKMWHNILLPLGVSRPPSTLTEASDRYLAARETWERRLGVSVARDLEREVLPRVVRQ